MSETLRVRAYNVGLGDCILVTLPAGKERKHLLVDFGSTRGKDKAYLKAVCKDILEQVGDDPLAVFLSHGHMDHFKGLHNHLSELDAKTEVLLTTHHLRTAEAMRAGTRDGPVMSALDTVMKDLKSRLKSEKSDEETRALAEDRDETDRMLDELCKELGDRVRYLARGAHQVLAPFLRGTGAKIEILAPERDNTAYTERTFSKLLTAPERRSIGRGLILDMIRERIKSRVALKDLLMAEREYDNSTSLVFSLEWKGKLLLFPGDAELPSWEVMHEKGVLRPVDLLKVAHHASPNGTPVAMPEVWKSLIDKARKPRFLVSTYPRKDWGMPDPGILSRLGQEGQVISTEDVRGTPGFVDVLVS
ncbi:MAG: MBL fold metallo-hydrolase [Candidatus Thorarchaeota archaeon]|nr:MBL fold metallo-hydrolase [Candidatus Thorarchaeota archaeon]